MVRSVNYVIIVLGLLKWLHSESSSTTLVDDESLVGVKRRLVQLISNLVYNNKLNQDMVCITNFSRVFDFPFNWCKLLLKVMFNFNLIIVIGNIKGNLDVAVACQYVNI